MDNLLQDFLAETAESLDQVDVQLVKFEQDPANAKLLDNIFRLIHTIKGTCGFLALPRLEAIAHAAETLMGKFRDGATATSEAVSLMLLSIDRIKSILTALERLQAEPEGSDKDIIAPLNAMAEQAKVTSTPFALPAAAGEEKGNKNQTVRVSIATLETLGALVSELALTRNQLVELARRPDDGQEDNAFKVPLQRLAQVTAALQDSVMKTRTQPIGTAWQKLPRLVRALARDLGKTITLDMTGAETLLDRRALELIKDPLVHMVRNAADHGLEPAAVRRAAGKPAAGVLRLSACAEDGYVIIQLADDGKGLDTERIAAQAVEKGLATPADIEGMPAHQVQKFIFMPGFSTAAQVTSVSGRGVGLDVVKTNIDDMGGTLGVASVKGAGTTFTIKIPLARALVPALVIETGGERFALPHVNILDVVRVSGPGEHGSERVEETPVLRVRNRLLPLVPLKQMLGLEKSCGLTEGFVVVTQAGDDIFGLVVDAVFPVQDVVVKPMSVTLRHIPFFAGNAVLDDGNLILMIDPNGVAQTLSETGEPVENFAAAVACRTEIEKSQAFIVFHAGHKKPKAVPLARVARLEDLDVATFEHVHGRTAVPYRGGVMPLVPAAPHMNLHAVGTQPVLVLSDAGRCVGLLVDEIVDIVEERFEIAAGTQQEGAFGTVLIQNRATDLVDVAPYITQGCADGFLRQGHSSTKHQGQIVLVDDSAFFRILLTPVLKAAGYDVHVFPCARDALETLKTGVLQPRAVVVDIEMPAMSGLEFARQLRSDERHAFLPLVALSARADSESVKASLAAGFSACIAKFDRHGLLAALRADEAQAA